jgi:hypothetical protein
MRKSRTPATGLAVLPTATKFHVAEPVRSAAFEENRFCFVLEAIDPSAPHAQVARVALTSPDQPVGWTAGEVIDTRHLTGKQLPLRRVVAVLFDGVLQDGEPQPKGTSLPHWEMVEGTGRFGETVLARIEARQAILKKAAPGKQLALPIA